MGTYFCHPSDIRPCKSTLWTAQNEKNWGNFGLAALEQRIGHTLSPSRVRLPELTGVPIKAFAATPDSRPIAWETLRPTP